MLIIRVKYPKWTKNLNYLYPYAPSFANSDNIKSAQKKLLHILSSLWSSISLLFSYFQGDFNYFFKKSAGGSSLPK